MKEFDDVVFGIEDTGRINLKNDADIYEPKYALDEVHGPVATQFGFHLIKIETRYISESDFRRLVLTVYMWVAVGIAGAASKRRLACGSRR